ncbi:MAG: glycerophosphodiester phosphodiesterase [Infirmifilum sp.]
MNHLKRMFILTGHRGARALSPENTLPSFLKALECGATGVEFDVRKTADGIPVIIHDDELKLLTGVEARVSQLAFNELSKLKVLGAARIPTLREVLALAKGRLYVDIEIKVPGVEEEVADALRELGMIQDALVTSFLPGTLEQVKKIEPRVEVGLLLEEWDEEYLELAQKIGAKAILPAYEIITYDLVQKVKSQGYALITWTVNNLQDATHLLSLGVDGIITDDPCQLQQIKRLA